MADQKKAGMISGFSPLAVITGDELMEVSSRQSDGSWKTFSILINKIRTNEGLSAYEVALVNGFVGTQQEWLESLVGKSAYELAVSLGFEGTEEEWLKTLVGPSAYKVAVENGYNGTEEEWVNSLKGKSAYQIAQEAGYEGTEAEWLESLKGKSAYQIAKELDPSTGTEAEWLASLIGPSAYDIAVDEGFSGDKAAWLESLKGLSAYQIWVAEGNTGTAEDFLESLKGADGKSAYKEWLEAGNTGTAEEFLESLNGTDGKSAYQEWLDAGNTGDEADFVASMQGKDGESAYDSYKKLPGNENKTEAEFIESLRGAAGKNAYQLAVEDGYTGTLAEWLKSLEGQSAYQLWLEVPENAGKTEAEFLASLKGEKGEDGTDGEDGQSAFALWESQPANTGKTEEDFLKSLEGASAFDTYKSIPGNENKTEAEFIASLKGEKGENGTNGKSAFKSWQEQPGNEDKTEADFAAYMKGTEGKAGANGKDGKSINVIATISQTDFDQIVADGDSVPGDAYIVGDFIYVFNSAGEWVKSNSVRGPDGKGLNYLGEWQTGLPLPTGPTYVAGDTFVWGQTAGSQSLWTLVEEPTRKWVDIGVPGPKGADGKDAYQTFLEIPGNAGKTKEEFIEAIKGGQGEEGPEGPEGKSAYDVAVEAGFEGTEEEWLTSLEGQSAYKLWESKPENTGKTEAQFIASLKGEPAAAFEIKDQLANVSELPRPGNPTEAYYVGKDLYVWFTTKDDYENLGSLDGASAYQIWLANGGVGTEEDFLASLKGANGKSAYELWVVKPGNEGKTEDEFLESLNGTDGASAFAIWQEQPGNEDKTEAEFIEFMKGKDGTDGKNLEVKGTLPTSTEIEAQPTPAAQDAYVADDTGHLWIYSGTAWFDAGPFRGEDGKSAYQEWLDAGNTGTEGDFVEYMEGKTGEDGASAYQLAVDGGFVGDQVAWLASLKGKDGRNVQILGSVETFDDLPVDPAAQDAYTVRDTNTLYMYIGAAWVNLGEFKGDQGDKGIQGDPGMGINIVGEVELLTDRPAAATLNAGDAIFVQEDSKLYQVNEAGVYNPGINIRGLQGEDGREGPEGPAGKSISIMGSFANEGDLVAAHPTGNPGEGYLIGDDLYLYGANPEGGATEWYNAGPVRGPEGKEGKEGKRGLRGETGQTGERGALWLNMPTLEEPTPGYGRPGDWAVVKDFETWYKDEANGWTRIGRLVAGDVNSPPVGDGKVVRLGNAWVPLPVDAVPNAVADKQYVMKGIADGKTVWAEISIPASGIADVPAGTTVPQGRTSTGWTAVMAAPTGLDETKRYELKNNVFVLSAIQADAPSTANVALCYRVNAQGDGSWVPVSFDVYSLLTSATAAATSFTPDLAKQQCYRVASNTGAVVTITLPAFTNGRSMMLVFTMEGNQSKAVFAPGVGSNIAYNNNVEAADIEYGAQQTVITAFWNGFGTWIISKGPSY